MLAQSCLLVVSAAHVAGDHRTVPSKYELFYTASEIDDRIASPATSKGRGLDGRGPAPIIKFWLASTTFDETGANTGRRNVTAPEDGMGYLSLSPDGKRALFATERRQPEGWSNVDTYVVPRDGSVPPRPLLPNKQPELLAPCANATPPCTQISTFHAAYTPDGQHVVFAYRAWTQLGVAVGSQALAMADANGSNVRVLTHESDFSIQDMCPLVLADVPDQVVFMRSLQSGMHAYIAVLNTTSSEVTLHDEWPEVGDSSGCPAPRASDEIMYLGCANPPCDVMMAAGPTRRAVVNSSAWRWGQRGPPRQLELSGSDAVRAPPNSSKAQPSDAPAKPRHPGWAQLRVGFGRDGKPKSTPSIMFTIGLTTAPGYMGVYDSSQCDRIWGAASPRNDSIICQGADPEHLFFLKQFVNPKSGAAARNDTSNLQHVMTPRPYALWQHGV